MIIEKSYKEFSSGYGEHYLPIKILNQSLPKNSSVKVNITGLEEGEDPWLIGIINDI